MSAHRSLERAVLAPAEKIIEVFANRSKGQAYERRFQLLEAAASRFGGFNLRKYQKLFAIEPVCTASDLAQTADDLVRGISKTGIPPALALSALARERLSDSVRRNTGAYHTDFRLALHLAGIALADLSGAFTVVDPACGSGILLAAVVHQACGSNRQKATEFLRRRVYAADLSAAALRGATLSLASFTSDLDAVTSMRSRWLCQDSLLSGRKAWESAPAGGFDLVIGNPPWEKVKTSRHESLKATGAIRHYGSEYRGFTQTGFKHEQAAAAAYSRTLAARYKCARGEIDLYAAFLEMFLELVADEGRMAALVPAGLIRSQSTELLRRVIFRSSPRIMISVIDNRARFFEIDTRFKFLAIRCEKGSKHSARRNAPITLTYAVGTATGVTQKSRVQLGRAALNEVRPDLTIPEVRTSKEWQLFKKMSRTGIAWHDESERWAPEIVREVDMTRDRARFIKRRRDGYVALVEGRMVHHHRFGAKAYVRGTGRSAIWRPLPIGQSIVAPQFWVDPKRISEKVRDRAAEPRAGFCDITGQTNERSLMAAMIPAGVICGNKVPTVTFPKDRSSERLLLWLGIVNSLPFDWLLRRVVTTTVNYFVLLSLQLPRISRRSLPGRQIIECVRRLQDIDAQSNPNQNWSEAASLRARIDVEVAKAYGLTLNDMKLLLEDFPLLDRGQPALSGEGHSTITRDFVLLTTARRNRCPIEPFVSRVERALAIGAIPYIPEEYNGGPKQMAAMSG